MLDKITSDHCHVPKMIFVVVNSNVATNYGMAQGQFRENLDIGLKFKFVL